MAADETRPFFTFYDDSTGERTELSFVTAANWIAKTANLVVDLAGVEPQEPAAIDMPPHWLTAVIMLGCWEAGLSIAHEPSDAAIAFAAAGRCESAKSQQADELWAVELAPLAVGLRPGPAMELDAEDFLVEVRGCGDHFAASSPVTDESVALTAMPAGPDSLTHKQVVEAATRRAEELGISAGERVMMTAAGRAPLDWLLVPLAVGGSIVVVAGDGSNLDLGSRGTSENARFIQ